MRLLVSQHNIKVNSSTRQFPKHFCDQFRDINWPLQRQREKPERRSYKEKYFFLYYMGMWREWIIGDFLSIQCKVKQIFIPAICVYLLAALPPQDWAETRQGWKVPAVTGDVQGTLGRSCRHNSMPLQLSLFENNREQESP